MVVVVSQDNDETSPKPSSSSSVSAFFSGTMAVITLTILYLTGSTCSIQKSTGFEAVVARRMDTNPRETRENDEQTAHVDEPFYGHRRAGGRGTRRPNSVSTENDIKTAVRRRRNRQRSDTYQYAPAANNGALNRPVVFTVFCFAYTFVLIGSGSSGGG